MKTLNLILLFVYTAQVCISQSIESEIKTKDTSEFEIDGGSYTLSSSHLIDGRSHADDLERIFDHPPHAAKPRVYWFWMGTHLTKEGITRDLEALKDNGFGGTLMFHLTDVPTTWSADIGKSPTPEILTWSEKNTA